MEVKPSAVRAQSGGVTAQFLGSVLCRQCIVLCPPPRPFLVLSHSGGAGRPSLSPRCSACRWLGRTHRTELPPPACQWSFHFGWRTPVWAQEGDGESLAGVSIPSVPFGIIPPLRKKRYAFETLQEHIFTFVRTYFNTGGNCSEVAGYCTGWQNTS